MQNRDSPISSDILPFSVVSWGKVAQSSLLLRFPSRFSDNLRKTSAPIVRLRAVRAHFVKMGPDMHCCRSSWPIRNVTASLLHSRSLPMRTKLGDQQYIVHLSEIARCGRFTLASDAFFMACEAAGAQEDALSKPRRRLAQPLRPDLSLTTQNNMSLRPYRRFFPSVAAQRRRCRHCLLSPRTQPATVQKSHS